jgi:hypothetical protein
MTLDQLTLAQSLREFTITHRKGFELSESSFSQGEKKLIEAITIMLHHRAACGWTDYTVSKQVTSSISEHFQSLGYNVYTESLEGRAVTVISW